MTLPVTVLSGYLGAGKTTLVNQMLRQADGKRLAIMVNEFGDLPIDADLIEAEGDDLIALAGGCVCCSYGDDLMAALAQMAALQPPPDHIVLEASGVALPGAIAASLSLMAGIEPAGVVVLADVGQIDGQLANDYIGDTVVRQLEAADLVVLTKGDIVSAEQMARAAKTVHAHSRNAAIIKASQGHLPLDVVLHPSQVSTPQAGKAHGNAAGLESEVAYPEMINEAQAYAKSLADRMDVIRAKGHVITPDGLQTVQVVGDSWEVHTAPQNAQVGVVIISLKQVALA
ncbi:GTP-binding protein [uncultured Sulfitobacter sp.]|uniref:CobW family GTP-binding protein n=1 Tax=uncultured Sulfitobacter sp. TaxID=191468 RepID=UPI002608B8E6|nr:GTP-binding protein [uncultured Sulfitobacter sp.]